MHFDVIIVGGGAAGCVLASRLSEDATTRVALIEAGRDYGADEPAPMLDSYSRASSHPEFFWPGLRARLRDDSAEDTAFTQACVLGGGSAVMGMQALRGLADDYDEWARAGAAGWGWDGVLPYFIRLERDLDHGGASHGSDGPIPIWRRPPVAWPPFARALATALAARGHDAGQDMNVGEADGLYPLPTSGLPQRRVTSAAAYLGPAVRARQNLAILAGQMVERLIIEDRAVTGVVVRSQAGMATLRAGRIVLAAGGIQSPALLLRSGTGPAKHLASLEIPVVADRPGVGANLLNHPLLAIGARLRPAARQGDGLRPHIHSMLRYSSGMAGCPPGDMYVSILNKTAWHRLGRGIGALSVSAYKSYSRGRLSLRSESPADQPRIDFAMLSDPRDLARMADGLSVMIDLLSDPGIVALTSGVFVPAFSRTMRRLSRPGLGSALAAALLARVMDFCPPVERRILLLAGEDPRALRGRDAIEEFARRRSIAMFHPAGTCRMGAAEDGLAVVDPRCRVMGVEGLHVADASIMPTIPRANTFLPVTMIGERAAAMLRADMRG